MHKTAFRADLAVVVHGAVALASVEAGVERKDLQEDHQPLTDRCIQAVAAVALVQLEQQEEQAAATVARVRHISRPSMRVAAAVVVYLMRTETVQADLAVVVTVAVEREQTALAAAAVDRLQIFQDLQVHQRREKVEMVVLFFVI